MSAVIIALYWCFAATLVFAGAAKLARPSALASLLSETVPLAPVVVRLLGLIELTVGCAALFGAPGAPLAVAGVYFVLAAGAEAALRRGATGSCGCFGAARARLSVGHVMFDLVGAGVALAAGAIWLLSSHELSSLATVSGEIAVLLGVQLVAAAWLSARLLTDLADSWDVWNNPLRS